MNNVDVYKTGTRIQVIILLGDGYTVAGEFYDIVKHQVAEVIPAVERDVTYTAEDLCGDVFWSLLSRGERRLAGRCLAHMVIVRGLLPLVHCQCRHEYPYRYKLA